MPHLVSIQVGQPQTHESSDAANSAGAAWTTGFYKERVTTSVHVGRTNIAGDGQADLEHHGGPDKAVLAYSAEHYPLWHRELGIANLAWGGFGENLTIAGLDERLVCIGDTWQVGDVLFQVTQPRQPCWKLARRWQITDLPAQVIANGRSGWYLRVLTEGTIAPEMELTLVQRPHPAWTVFRAADVMHHHKKDRELAAELDALPELSGTWHVTLSRRAGR